MTQKNQKDWLQINIQAKSGIMVCESALRLTFLWIAYLQAFTDVNKRTSRLSANIPLIQHNQVPLSFNDVEKDDYNSAMIAFYELNDVKPCILAGGKMDTSLRWYDIALVSA